MRQAAVLILCIILSGCLPPEARLAPTETTTPTVSPQPSAPATETLTNTPWYPTVTPRPPRTPTLPPPPNWPISVLQSYQGDELPPTGPILSCSGNLIDIPQASLDAVPVEAYACFSDDGSTAVFEASEQDMNVPFSPECHDDDGTCRTLFVYHIPADALYRVPMLRGYSSIDMALSADGRYLAYAVPDGLKNSGVYLFDRDTQQLRPIRPGVDGNQRIDGSDGGTLVDMSADGRYIAFVSADNGITPADDNNAADVFLYYRETGFIERVSRPYDSIDSGLPSGHQWRPNTGGARESGLSISANGRYVVFMSLAPNLVVGDYTPCLHWGWTDEIWPACRHIYLYDRVNRSTEIIDVATDGTPGNHSSEGGDVSADGRYVVYESRATNLIEGTAGECSGDGWCPQVYVRDREARRTYHVNRGWDGQPSKGTASLPTITGDGQHIVFVSDAKNLVFGVTPENNGESLVYLVDLAGLLALTP